MAEHNNGQRVQRPNTFDSETWVLIETGTSAVIGRVTAADGDRVEGRVTANIRIAGADVLELNPVYDYVAPMRPVPVGPPGPGGQQQMALARDAIVMGHAFCVKSHLVYVRLGAGTRLTFLNDLAPSDQKTGEGLLEGARQQLEARAAQDLGLTLASGVDLANLGRPPRG